MNKLLFILSFIITTSTVQAQVGVDPHVIGKDGSPVVAPAKADTRYNNRIRNSRTETGTPPGLREYNEMRLSEGEEAPLYYEHGRNEMPSDNADTTRIYFFDAEGNAIRDPHTVYRDLGPQLPPTNAGLDSVDNSTQTPEPDPAEDL